MPLTKKEMTRRIEELGTIDQLRILWLIYSIKMRRKERFIPLYATLASFVIFPILMFVK